MFARVDASGVELRRAVSVEPERLDLVAMVIARLDDEPWDEAATVATLDRWAGDVAASIAGGREGRDALASVLGGHHGLRGDDDQYDDPSNSFLPRVLERRCGLPILLSIVYLEVARRAGVPLFGLALPGHFVVGQRTGSTLTVLDPFAGGREMSQVELQAIVSRVGAALQPSMFEPASAHTIATRMLRNLIGSYQRRDRGDKTREAARLLLALEPDDTMAGQALAAVEDPTAEEELN